MEEKDTMEEKDITEEKIEWCIKNFNLSHPKDLSLNKLFKEVKKLKMTNNIKIAPHMNIYTIDGTKIYDGLLCKKLINSLYEKKLEDNHYIFIDMDDNSNQSSDIECLILRHNWNNSTELNFQLLYNDDDDAYYQYLTDYNNSNLIIINCLRKYYQIFFDIEFIKINSYYYPKIMIPSYLKDSYVDNDNIRIDLK